MKIGFIGAGNVAQVYARFFAMHGLEVVLSNSKGPGTLNNLVKDLGTNVKAGTAEEAAAQEIVILATRWEHAEKALAQISDWNGRILVDATNNSDHSTSAGKTDSEIIAGFAPGARLVKALNTLVVNWIPEDADQHKNLVLFLAGDDGEAKKKVASALQTSGFVPVDTGGLIQGGKLQDFGGPLSGLHMNLTKRLEF